MRMVRRFSVDMKIGEEDKVISSLLVEAIDENLFVVLE